jgi:methylenetetrahydrofolate dehydrogenase (NADP+)/methenyltetrahydrofolate cyclohydrolase
MAMLEHFQVPLDGKHAVIVGRSPVVGRPMALMLLAANATVTICHSRTADLHAYTQQADILIAAAGRARMITGEMVKPGATVIDFGVNVVDGEVCGDVDDRSVSVVAGALTPVPGGTGNVTTAVLLRNTVKAAWRQLYRETREEIG